MEPRRIPDQERLDRVENTDETFQQTKKLLVDLEAAISGVRDLPGVAEYLIDKGWRKP